MPSTVNTPPRWCARRWPSVTPTRCTRAVSASTPPCAKRIRRQPTWRCAEASSSTTAAAAIGALHASGDAASESCSTPRSFSMPPRHSLPRSKCESYLDPCLSDVPKIVSHFYSSIATVYHTIDSFLEKLVVWEHRVLRDGRMEGH